MSLVNSSDFSPSSETPRRYAIVGAGITGLSAAQALISGDPSASVTIFEGSERAGGIIQTVHDNGFMLELGPDSFITNKPAAIRLCEEIGFSNQLIPTDNQHRRSLVLSEGKPAAVPAGFLLMAPSNLTAIAKTDVLSAAGRLRLLQEAHIPPAPEITDESLANFVRRRFGREVLDRLVQPLVGGIYTSDPEKLSIQATLPRFQQMEQDYGSVTVGTLLQSLKTSLGQRPANNSGFEKAAPGDGEPGDGEPADGDPADNVTAESTASSGARYGLFTAPKDGMSSLVQALQNWLTNSGRCSIQFNTKVSSLNQQDSSWHLKRDGGSAEVFDAVIVTLPTYRAAELLPAGPLDCLKQKLSEIEYASSAIVVSTHQLSDFEHPLDAFGLVVPMREQRDILAVSFSSRKFPGRAPNGSIILRTFVGGATQPHLLAKSDSEIESLVNRELSMMLGMQSKPSTVRVARYNKAMPQYHVGHLGRVAEIERLASGVSGLELAGSAYHGVGIPDSVASGHAAAIRVLTARYLW